MWFINQYPVTNLSNWLEANQCIDDDRWNNKNWQPCQNSPQTCGRRKYVYTVWIRRTNKFLTCLRTSFSINERWSNKYYTHKSKIIKGRLERKTWLIFYINQSNPLNLISLNTQLEPLSQTSTNLQGWQICMSSLDTSHIKFSNTPEETFQGQ